MPNALWALGAAAFWLVPDQKLLRWKLLAVQAVVVLIGARLCATKRGGVETPLDYPVAALTAAGLLFWALSPDRSVAMTEALRLAFCGLVFWAASRSGAAEPELAAWTAGASAAGLWAVVQAFGGEARPFASFGNPIFLGTALAASLPLALAGAFRAAGKERGLWLTALALESAGLLLSHSRSAALGLLAGLCLWAFARSRGGRAAAAALAALAAAWVFRNREWTHLLIWRDTISLWKAHPLLGCGLGRFHLEFQAFASEALKARWPDGKVIINFAHNEYLQTLAETGPLGLAALLSVPAAAWLELRRDGGRPEAAAGALALFAAAFVSPDLRFGVSTFAAFFLFGAAVKPRAAGKAWPAAVPAAALLAFAALAVQPALAVRRNAAEAPFAAAVDSARIKELEARDARDADAAEQLGFLKAKASDFAGARAAFLRAAELAPTRPGPLNNLGNIAYLSGDRPGAIDWWKKSLAVAPEQIDARINLGKLLCESGRLKECSAQLEEVLKRDPSNAKARVLYKKMVE